MDDLLWADDVVKVTGRTAKELNLKPVVGFSVPRYRKSDVLKHADPPKFSYWEGLVEEPKEEE